MQPTVLNITKQISSWSANLLSRHQVLSIYTYKITILELLTSKCNPLKISERYNVNLLKYLYSFSKFILFYEVNFFDPPPSQFSSGIYNEAIIKIRFSKKFGSCFSQNASFTNH